MKYYIACIFLQKTRPHCYWVILIKDAYLICFPPIKKFPFFRNTTIIMLKYANLLVFIQMCSFSELLFADYYNSYFEFSAACKLVDGWFNSNSFNFKVILKVLRSSKSKNIKMFLNGAHKHGAQSFNWNLCWMLLVDALPHHQKFPHTYFFGGQ